MKLGRVSIVLAVEAVLAGIVEGHPHELKRALVTEIFYSTVTVGNVFVYVDGYGVPFSTTTVKEVATVLSTSTQEFPATPTVKSIENFAQPTLPAIIPVSSPVSSMAFAASASRPSSIASKSIPAAFEDVHTSFSLVSQVSPSSSYTAPPKGFTPVHLSAPSSSAMSTPSPSAAEFSEDRWPLGVTYDPFTSRDGGKTADCKTEKEIADEWAKMKDFGIVRIYGQACNQIPIAFQQAKRYNQKLMAGIYVPLDNIQDVVNTLNNAVNRYASGNWDIVSLVSVENEKVNSHEMTASDAVDAVQQTKDALRSAGYSGPVGAVETAPATIDDPAICQHSDVTLVNIHAFFDQNTKAQDAGKFVKGQVDLVQQACPNKRVIVTESGWPHAGVPNGQAVPSKDNQRAAIASIRSVFDHDLFLHNAFDCNWKALESGTFNAERYWGFL